WLGGLGAGPVAGTGRHRGGGAFGRLAAGPFGALAGEFGAGGERGAVDEPGAGPLGAAGAAAPRAQGEVAAVELADFAAVAAALAAVPEREQVEPGRPHGGGP